MTNPDYQSLMLPVLALAAKQELRVPEAEPEERETVSPSGCKKPLSNPENAAPLASGAI